MKKIIGATGSTGLLAVLLFSSASSVLAQGGGRDFDGPPPGGPGFGERQGGRQGRGPGGMRGMGGKRDVSRLWRGIGRLEKSSTPLSKAQAKRVVAVVLPWSKRSQMSNAEAEKVEAQLTAILTPAQKSALQKGRGRRGGFERPGGPGGPGGREGRGPGGPEGRGDGPDSGRRGGRGGEGFGGAGGPGGAGRPGGGRGMSGQMMQQMRAFMEKFNPFYAPTGYSQWKQLPERMQERMTDRYKDDRALLEALSKKSRS